MIQPFSPINYSAASAVVKEVFQTPPTASKSQVSVAFQSTPRPGFQSPLGFTTFLNIWTPIINHFFCYWHAGWRFFIQASLVSWNLGYFTLLITGFLGPTPVAIYLVLEFTAWLTWPFFLTTEIPEFRGTQRPGSTPCHQVCWNIRAKQGGLTDQQTPWPPSETKTSTTSTRWFKMTDLWEVT